MEVDQEKFEQSLMNLILQGEHPVLAILRQQYVAAKIVGREFSGVGFFTYFEVPHDAPLVEPSNFAGGNVNIQLENLRDGAGCVLFVREGKLSTLECYTFTEPWPEPIIVKSLSDPLPALPE